MLWYEWLIIGIVFAVALVGMVFSILPYLSPVSVAHGGTAAKTVETARVNLGIPDVLPITQGGTGSIDVTSARKALSIPAILPVTAGGTGSNSLAAAQKTLGVYPISIETFSYPGPGIAPTANASNNTSFFDEKYGENYSCSGLTYKIGNDYVISGVLTSTYSNADHTAVFGMIPIPVDPSTYTVQGGVVGGYVGTLSGTTNHYVYVNSGYVFQTTTTHAVYLFNTWMFGLGGTLGSTIQVQYVLFMHAN